MIAVAGLTKTYRMGETEVHALRDVTLSVAAGEHLAIMGPSGSGKSTLMNLLGCLDTPTAGSYRLRGHEVSCLADDELARIRNQEIGFVFQTFNLLPRLTALENVALPLLYSRVEPRDQSRRAAAALELVGLQDRGLHRPAELSGGHRQRVAIARALINEPAIVLADEPTGNLDSVTSREILDLLCELNRRGRTLIMVTHNPEVAARAARVIHLRDGSIHEEITA